MKGFACEGLILAGAYLFVQNPATGGALIGLGAVLSAIRYGIELGRAKVKDDLFSDFRDILGSVTKAASSLDYEKLQTRHKETIH